MLFRIS
ncbi:hypothetical protein D018_2225A, partial [Vibrio parahaemolyticus VP2007-007]